MKYHITITVITPQLNSLRDPDKAKVYERTNVLYDELSDWMNKIVADVPCDAQVVIAFAPMR